ncbi:MAG TPA: hypothetical protein VN420_01555 [Candidatus Fimivivens sp.]|nr:hypothetical protein [Candidatus Fimivivens sp.]
MSSGAENVFSLLSGMMEGIRQEWSGDILRGRVRLASLLQEALHAASDCANAIFLISEAEGVKAYWPYRMSPFEVGRQIVHLRYDRTCLVVRGILEGVGRPASDSCPVVRSLLALLSAFERIHALCEPFIRMESE